MTRLVASGVPAGRSDFISKIISTKSDHHHREQRQPDGHEVEYLGILRHRGLRAGKDRRQRNRADVHGPSSSASEKQTRGILCRAL
jgi:hypothetical protein